MWKYCLMNNVSLKTGMDDSSKDPSQRKWSYLKSGSQGSIAKLCIIFNAQLLVQEKYAIPL